jgi:hypothetical protein
VNIYCDESGGIGRGVMTLAAVAISESDAEALLLEFKRATGLRSELKGSRIDLDERAYFLKLFEQANARARVGVAIHALKPQPGEDRGAHDQKVYTDLFEMVLGAFLPETGGCAHIIFDEGRYSPVMLNGLRQDLADMVGALGKVDMDASHHRAGLQIADVLANSFFNRALVSERQGRFLTLLQPFLESEQIRLQILEANA